MKYICFIPEWQEIFDTHNWSIIDNDIECKTCGLFAPWITGTENKR